MAAPTITWGTVNFGTNGTSVDVNEPAGIVAGDLLLLFRATDSTTAPTTPAGWTLLYGGAQTSRIDVYARIATAANETVTSAGPSQDYVLIMGRVPAAEHGVTNVATDIVITNAGSSSGNANPPWSGTVASKDWLSIAACAIDFNSSSNTITAAPSGMTAATLTKSASSTSSVALGVAYRYLTDQVFDDAGTFTNSSRPWRAVTMLVPPSEGAAPAAITDLSAAAASSTSVDLSWTAPADGGSAITDYEYRYGPTGGSFGSWTSTGSTSASYTVTGLTASTEYDFQVRAVNAIGSASNSNTATATTSASGGGGGTYTVTDHGDILKVYFSSADYEYTSSSISLPANALVLVALTYLGGSMGDPLSITDTIAGNTTWQATTEKIESFWGWGFQARMFWCQTTSAESGTITISRPTGTKDNGIAATIYSVTHSSGETPDLAMWADAVEGIPGGTGNQTATPSVASEPPAASVGIAVVCDFYGDPLAPGSFTLASAESVGDSRHRSFYDVDSPPQAPTFTNLSGQKTIALYAIIAVEGDEEPPPPGDPGFTEEFTGSNGSAWPAEWTTDNSTGAGTIDQQSGRGRMVTATTNYNVCRAVLKSTTFSATDTECYGEVETPTGNRGQANIVLRGGGVWSGDVPTDGYTAQLNMSGDTLFLLKTVAGSTTQIGSSVPFTFTTGTVYKYRFRVEGTALKFRVWTGATEPSTWQLEETDSAIAAAGQVQLAFRNLSGGDARTLMWDNIAVTDLAAPPALALPKVRIGGAWITPTGIKVRIGGAWIDVVGVKVRVAGAWVDLN